MPFFPESPMPEPLAALRDRLPAGGRVQVFTDFDGTLAEIVPDPLHIELAADVRAALEAAADCPRLRLAVVSGRDLVNLVERVRLPGVAYAGNHGLEISDPSGSFTEPTAEAMAGELAEVVAELRASLPEVWVQDKRLTATVHVPGLADFKRDEIAEWMRGAISGRFVVCEGRATIDVRPPADWHKGSAVWWLRDRWVDPAAVPVFLGDDPTDEDGFAACSDGVTVLVGPERPTRATHRLPDPTAVAGFLRGVVAILGRR